MKPAAFAIVLALTMPFRAWGAEKQYECEKVWPGTISIDGKLDESAWKVAFGLELVDSRTGEKPRQATTARLLWDSEHLYVGFECKDRDVWGTLTQRDDPVFAEEAVEVFIAPDGAERPYYELDLNALGTLFDTRIEDRALMAVNSERWWKTFNSRGEWAVKVEGTANDVRDEDRGWTVEMAIPFADLGLPEGRFPEAGDAWRANLYRLDWPAEEKGQELIAWSPTGSSFHVPEKFGEVVFRDTFFYQCRRVEEASIKVDGGLDEEAWQDAEPAGRFRNSYTAAFARQGTVAKMLWDEQNLYLGFECEDTDVWATMRQRDQDLWQEEVVEAFIAPPLMTNGYFEFEINPLNVLLDIAVINPTGGMPEGMYFNKRYDARGLVSAVKVNGTVDKRDDVDRGWTVEVAIPFADLISDGKKGPASGDIWRIGLYRCDVAKQESEYTAWSPTGSWFHIPVQFGAMIFVEGK